MLIKEAKTYFEQEMVEGAKCKERNWKLRKSEKKKNVKTFLFPTRRRKDRIKLKKSH